MQIWYELQQAGQAGLTFEELLSAVSPRVPAGYAWRRYLRQRSTSGRTASGSSVLPPLADTPGARAAATRYLVRHSAQAMVQLHTAIRRPDGRYAVGPRKPKSVFSDEQHDFDGSVSRRAVAMMEWLRLARALVTKVETDWKPKHEAGDMPTLTVAFYAATKRLVEAHT